MKAVGGGAAGRVNQGARILFVEGDEDNALDPVLLRELLANNGLTNIDVRPMGGCDHVRSAAQALVRHHPSYYFLVDRDDLDDEIVEGSWQNFPDPATHNLLIWRKREIENYFIDPDYLSRSAYLTVAEAELQERIRGAAQRRLYLDAANLALLAANRALGRPIPASFSDPSQFGTHGDGEQQLTHLAAIATRRAEITDLLTTDSLLARYNEFVGLLTGGVASLVYGQGEWLNRLAGKEIFHAVAGPCFRVQNRDRKVLQGREQWQELVKNLMRKDLAEQPADFQALVGLLKARR